MCIYIMQGSLAHFVLYIQYCCWHACLADNIVTKLRALIISKLFNDQQVKHRHTLINMFIASVIYWVYPCIPVWPYIASYLMLICTIMCTLTHIHSFTHMENIHTYMYTHTTRTHIYTHCQTNSTHSKFNTYSCMHDNVKDTV